MYSRYSGVISGAVCQPVPVPIHQQYMSGVGATELARGFDDRLKYSLEIGCRSCEDGKNLARRSKLLTCLSKLNIQPFDLGCHPPIDGRILVGQTWLVALGHSASPHAAYPRGSPPHQCPLMAAGIQHHDRAGNGLPLPKPWQIVTQTVKGDGP